MSRRGEGFDEETEIQADPYGLPTTAVRHRPQITWSDASGSHVLAIDDRVLVGSAHGVAMIVDDSAVSRIHAEFEVRDDGLWVRDLGSRNGTYVDGVLVGSARVPEGGAIRVGGATLTVSYATPPASVNLWPSERFGPLLGRSAAMRELFARLARVAPTDSTVLLQGETGTGKEVVARALHEASRRAEAPFVIVDCGALPENLLESELFGHAKGAFTGALASRAGAIESAEGGTVFLDEIGELPLAMQPKLLRAIESRTVRRLGEVQHRKVNVRFLSATHRDLRTMVNNGAFREDLYFRLAVLPVNIPPLRERPDDIPLLIEHFRATSGAQADVLPPDRLREAATRPWIGNVRELRNFVERAVALGAQEALAMVPNARTSLPPPGGAGPRGAPGVSTEMPFKDQRERWLDHFEREYLQAMLAKHQHNVSAVAQAAGLDRSYVHRMMRKHDL